MSREDRKYVDKRRGGHNGLRPSLGIEVYCSYEKIEIKKSRKASINVLTNV